MLPMRLLAYHQTHGAVVDNGPHFSFLCIEHEIAHDLQGRGLPSSVGLSRLSKEVIQEALVSWTHDDQTTACLVFGTSNVDAAFQQLRHRVWSWAQQLLNKQTNSMNVTFLSLSLGLTAHPVPTSGKQQGTTHGWV